MISQHTPGPWKIEGDNIYGPNDQRIADVWSGYEDEIHADARLIAAAPDLLEALKWVVRISDEGGYPDGKCLQEARAAIAKAEGEKS